jgi:hypothetical protein
LPEVATGEGTQAGAGFFLQPSWQGWHADLSARQGQTCPRERDEILGELSAAIFHLHTHTEGLDEYLCETA